MLEFMIMLPLLLVGASMVCVIIGVTIAGASVFIMFDHNKEDGGKWYDYGITMGKGFINVGIISLVIGLVGLVGVSFLI